MGWSLEHLRYTCIRAIVNTSLYVRSSPWWSPTTQPDQVKTYSSRPNLFASRIFTPRHDQTKEHPPAPSLVIRAHGGGFIVNNPAVDDPIARHLADNANCIVVSIDYSKAPQNKFPSAYEDVIAQSLAIIDDQHLTFDRSRVVLCGSSAGGNLVLAAAQDERLRSKVTGVAAIYPLVDLVPDGATKMATRPDPSVPDFIGDSYSGVLSIYLDATHKPALTDTRLSPAYFSTRESLPPQILIIGAEHDMFCHEDEAMANKVAALSAGSKSDTTAGWRAPGVQWHKIHGQPHAFDNFPAKTSEKEKARIAAVEELYTVISDWLSDIFSERSGK